MLSISRAFDMARWCVCLMAGLCVVVAGAAASTNLSQVAQLHTDSVMDVQSLLGLAESGDARASFLLGTRYASGRGGFRDDSEAVRWFKRAADKGLGEAQYNLGIMYGAGRGVARDIFQAVRWFRLAANQGVAEAQFNLGTLYSLGEGVSKDLELAAEWLHKAADRRLPRAQYNLGVLYEHGQGVRLDGRAALIWYQRAAKQGYEPAQQRLAALMERLQVSSVVDPEAAEGSQSASAESMQSQGVTRLEPAASVLSAGLVEKPATEVQPNAATPAASALGACMALGGRREGKRARVRLSGRLRRIAAAI